MTDKKPNPGSQEAAEQGCTCPVMDNHGGKGFRQTAEGDLLFWISGDCPLHGNKPETPNE